jgi:hypothetical protein
MSNTGRKTESERTKPVQPVQRAQPSKSVEPAHSPRPSQPAATWNAEQLRSLQRTAGNHAMAAFLGAGALGSSGPAGSMDRTRLAGAAGLGTVANAPASGAVVQRVPGEFIPDPRITPKEQHPLVGADFRERLSVANHRQAPHGTNFQWGGQTNDPDRVEFGDVAPTSSSGTSTLTTKAVKSGEASVGGSVQHQVPGGPLVVTEGPTIPVTIPRPTIVLMSSKQPVGPSASPDPLRLSVGDKLTVRADLIGVATRRNTAEVWMGGIAQGGAASAGTAPGVRAPAGGLPAGGGQVTFGADRKINENSHEFEFSAASPGQFQISVDWQVAGHTDEPPIEQTTNGTVEMDRRRFIDKCSEAHSLAGGQYAYLASNNATIANAYAQAWKWHTDALKAAAATERLMEALILNAALAFIPGGIGGLIGARVKGWYERDSADGNFMSDAMKDLFKDTVRRYAGQQIAGMHMPAYEAFPPDPLQTENLALARTEREKADVLMMINSWQAAANDHPEIVLDFDPVAVVRQACIMKGKPFESLEPATERDARLIEKGFWSGWVQQYGYYIHETYSCAGLHRSIEDKVSKDIRHGIKACADALGEDSDAWLSEWSDAAKARLQAQIDQQAGWRP